MKEVLTQDAVGMKLFCDLTQITTKEGKIARFRRGHIVQKEDVEVLLSMGKRHLFVYDERGLQGFLHEEDAAAVLAEVCAGGGVSFGAPKEGKIELKAEFDGFLSVDEAAVLELNLCESVVVSTKRSGFVKKGEVVAAVKVVPLFVKEELMRGVRQDFSGRCVLQVLPFVLQEFGLVVTGSEVKSGLIEDKFAPLMAEKLSLFGLRQVKETIFAGDDEAEVAGAIESLKAAGAKVVFATGGMSVDADDVTPKAVAKCVCEVASYGVPVLPGAMMMLGYFQEGVVLGVPAGVVFSPKSALEVLLPRILAGVKVTKKEIASLGYGGLL